MDMKLWRTILIIQGNYEKFVFILIKYLLLSNTIVRDIFIQEIFIEEIFIPSLTQINWPTQVIELALVSELA